jgi:hypothetical protein
VARRRNGRFAVCIVELLMPTPAPDRATLYNVEDAVDAACKAIIEANSDDDVFVPREVLNMTDSCITIRTRAMQNFGSREDAWNFEIGFEIWTSRGVDGPTVSGQRVGLLRDLFRRVPVGGEHPNFTEAVLPYHIINNITHAGCDGQCSLPDDLDLREVRFEGVVSVRPGCFPVEASTYLRPGGTDHYFRPDGTSRYLRPAA